MVTLNRTYIQCWGSAGKKMSIVLKCLPFFLVATNELKFFIITFFRFALALSHQVC